MQWYKYFQKEKKQLAIDHGCFFFYVNFWISFVLICAKNSSKIQRTHPHYYAIEEVKTATYIISIYLQNLCTAYYAWAFVVALKCNHSAVQQTNQLQHERRGGLKKLKFRAFMFLNQLYNYLRFFETISWLFYIFFVNMLTC